MREFDTADAILAVHLDEPERLFGSPDQIGHVFRHLAMRWHPDHAGRGDVFAHLLALREQAEERAATHSWTVPGKLEVVGHRIRYFHRFAFELGTAYVGNTVLAYVVEPAFADLAQRAEAAVRGINFADETMRREMWPRLPRLIDAFDGEAGQRVLVIEKPEGVIGLSDLIANGKNRRIDARHVAWMISELLNIACYFHAYLGVVHMGLAPDTLFVSPSRHMVLPLGGWFYAVRRNERLVAVPERTDRLLPMTVRRSEVAIPAIDLELIRAIGREALGDPAGTRLGLDPEVPPVLAEWLRSPSGNDTVAEYRRWPGILLDSFGARRFTELPVQASDIYGKEAHNG